MLFGYARGPGALPQARVACTTRPGGPSAARRGPPRGLSRGLYPCAAGGAWSFLGGIMTTSDQLNAARRRRDPNPKPRGRGRGKAAQRAAPPPGRNEPGPSPEGRGPRPAGRGGPGGTRCGERARKAKPGEGQGPPTPAGRAAEPRRAGQAQAADKPGRRPGRKEGRRRAGHAAAGPTGGSARRSEAQGPRADRPSQTAQ